MFRATTAVLVCLAGRNPSTWHAEVRLFLPALVCACSAGCAWEEDIPVAPGNIGPAHTQAEIVTSAPETAVSVQPVESPSIVETPPAPDLVPGEAIEKAEKGRTWKSADGSFTVEAEFLYFANGKVKIRRNDNGKELLVDLASLSTDDQEWVSERRRNASQPDVTNTKITLANFSRVQKGMPKEEVFRILGSIGAVQKDDVDNRDGTRSQMWVWTRAPSESCVIIFMDGVVGTKSQYGLK